MIHLLVVITTVILPVISNEVVKYFETLFINLVTYSMVTYGASCEEARLATITSLDDCNNALQELGNDHTPKGTVDTSFGPTGCYLRADGDLWYNLNGQSLASCTSQSTCICWTGEHLIYKMFILQG